MAISQPNEQRPTGRPRPAPLSGGPAGGLIAGSVAGLATIMALHLWLIGPPLPLAGPAAFVTLCLTLAALLPRHYPHPVFGACNLVTLIRAALVATLLAPLSDSGADWAVPGIAALALALDGVDGWLARRRGLASGFGARFDVEVDAALALVLTLHVLARGIAGPEALILGLTRYAFVAAAWALPWLAAPLPPRFRRKAICVLQLSVLVALLLPVLPGGLAPWLVAGASGALLASFVLDIRWLARAARG